MSIGPRIRYEYLAPFRVWSWTCTANVDTAGGKIVASDATPFLAYCRCIAAVQARAEWFVRDARVMHGHPGYTLPRR